MVQISENETICQTPVRGEKESLLSKFGIPIDHLDFKYVEECSSVKELERIIQILRSGEEGYYPQLLNCTEERLGKLNPNSKLLRTTVPVLTKQDISNQDWKTLTSDIQNWVKDVSKSDKELQSFQDLKPANNDLPVRESKISTNKSKTEKQIARIKSMEYEKWDKLDVDAEILKMELEEEKIKKDALKKEKEKEKLQTIELNPDFMSKTELSHAAMQAKNYGNESFKIGDYEDALQYYTNSLSFMPMAATYNNRAITNIKLQLYNEAIRDCNEVLMLEPRNEKAFLRKSQALKMIKQYDKAVDCLEKLIQFNPHNTDAQNMIRDLKEKLVSNVKVRTVRMAIEEENTTNKDAEQTANYTNNSVQELTEVTDVLVPIPGTSKSSGPFCKMFSNVPKHIAKKITNNKKTPAKSDENVIDLNKVNNDKFNKIRQKENEDPDVKVREKRKESIQVSKHCLTQREGNDGCKREKENVLEDVYNRGEPNCNFDPKNFTPYEFIKIWQSIKYDPSFASHEKLLRLLSPDDLVSGNKLDGEMLSALLRCLETRFRNEADATFVGNLLTELTKVPRIDIVMLFMGNRDKLAIRNILAFIKKHGFQLNKKAIDKYFYNSL